MVATAPTETTHDLIGVSRPRVDSREKVTGAAQYAADVAIPARELLHSRLVLSLYANARIDGIDNAAALGRPGVVAVLTADDIPIRGDGPERVYHPLARDRVLFAGQPVAIVVAKSESAAEDAVDAVVVRYDPATV